MTNPDLSAAEFSEFASRHTFDAIFDGRATPPAAVVPGTREALEKLLLSAKLLQQNSEACAANHYGGDCETFGLPGWLADTKRDIEAAQAALSAPVPPADGAIIDDWKSDPSADERWQAGLDFAMLQLCQTLGVDPKSVTWDAATETLDGDVCAVIWNILRAKMGDDWDPHAPPSGAGAAEPVAFPDYEAAASALGYQQIQSGTWFHPNQHPNFTERFTKAEEIFDRYFGKHWLTPVRGDREASVPPVVRIECVKMVDCFEVEADPLWRVEVGGKCADFETEAGANSFRAAILSLPVQSSAPVGVIAKLQEIVDLDSHGRYGRLAREAINEIQSSDGGVGSQTRKELSADAQSLMAAGNVDSLGVAPGPSEALSSAPVKKYAGNHSVALQFLFENETDGCPNCRGCAEHRCSSAPEATVSGEEWKPNEREAVHNAIFGTYGKGEGTVCTNLAPYVRSTVVNLRRAEALVKVFEDTNPDLVEKFRVLIDDQATGESSPQDVGREATIEAAINTYVHEFGENPPFTLEKYKAGLLKYVLRSLSRKGGER